MVQYCKKIRVSLLRKSTDIHLPHDLMPHIRTCTIRRSRCVQIFLRYFFKQQYILYNNGFSTINRLYKCTIVYLRIRTRSCCRCLHIKSRSGLYSVLSNIRTGPSDADAFRGHRLTTQKGYTYQKEIKGPRKVNTHAII